MSLRRVGRRVLLAAGLLVAVGVVLVAVSLIRRDPGVDMPALERQVRTAYEQKLNAAALEHDVHQPIDVLSVDCVDHKDGDAATCFAQVDGAVEGQAELDVTYGKGDRFVWREVSRDFTDRTGS